MELRARKAGSVQTEAVQAHEDVAAHLEGKSGDAVLPKASNVTGNVHVTLTSATLETEWRLPGHCASCCP